MRHSRKATRPEATSCLVILALVSALLFPMHYHMHHTGDPVLHEAGIQTHVIDIHGHSDINDIGHDEDGHIIDTAADGALKTPALKLPWVAILVTLLLLVPFPAQAVRRRPLPVLHTLPRFRQHNTPPLRAPPRA